MAGESARESARRQREKAERLQRSAELWERGAEGEQPTAEVLAKLPSDWTVFHDLHWPGRRFANVDHVVVGPPGVFVVDSKNWSGTVTVRDDVLRQNSYKREREVAGVAEAGLAIAQLVPLLHVDHVRPVLCFVGDRQLTGWARDVMVTSSDTLVPMLMSRPPVLEASELSRLCLDLDASLRPARGPATVSAATTRRISSPTRPSTTTPPSRPTTRARTRGRKASPLSWLPRALVLAGITAFFLIPGVRTAVTDAVTGFIVDTTSPGPGPATQHEKDKQDLKRKQHPKSAK